MTFDKLSEIMSSDARGLLGNMTKSITRELEKIECPNHKDKYSVTIVVGVSGCPNGVCGEKIIDSCCPEFELLIKVPVQTAIIQKSK